MTDLDHIPPGCDPATATTFHPAVDHYRDGGIGGIGEDHSVVGFVAPALLVPYRFHDGRWTGHTPANPDDDTVIDLLRRDLREGRGFHTPLMLEYSHLAQWAFLGEGNHRLNAALAEAIPCVPVRVVRSVTSVAARKAEGIGAPAAHRPIPGVIDPTYIPSDLHPDYLDFSAATRRRAHPA